MPDQSYDDDLIVDSPEPTPQPDRNTPARDPRTGQFVPPEQTQPQAPRHSNYALAKAREYGVQSPESMAPDTLDLILANLDRQRASLTQQKPAPAEEPIDWGEDADGKPLTEEGAKSFYTKAHFKAIRAGHFLPIIEKENAALKAEIERDRREREAGRVRRQAHAIMAEHPQLFGAKPGLAPQGSPEARRYAMVMREAAAIAEANGRIDPASDIPAAMEIFLPANPEPRQPPPRAQARSQQPSVDDYERASLARPTQRRTTESLTKRETMIRAEEEKLRENGVYAPRYNPATDNDNDDLPE